MLVENQHSVPEKENYIKVLITIATGCFHCVVVLNINIHFTAVMLISCYDFFFFCAIFVEVLDDWVQKK